MKSENQEVTTSSVKAAIKESGYPFELEIANRISKLGFDIFPSHRFFDQSKGKESEIDLLARRLEKFDTTGGKKLLSILELAVECKYTSLPYVCFGLPLNNNADDKCVDWESQYCHVETSRDDGLSNLFRFWIFDMDGGTDVKKGHHHFSSRTRFYTVTALERKKGSGGEEYLKLHVPEDFRHVLYKLGSFIASSESQWSSLTKEKRAREVLEIDQDASIKITFIMLVHKGKHFCYSLNQENVTEELHTPVFLNSSYSDKSIYYVVDLVGEEALVDAIEEIQASYHRMINHIGPILLARK